jgi:hypothetical protein
MKKNEKNEKQNGLDNSSDIIDCDYDYGCCWSQRGEVKTGRREMKKRDIDSFDFTSRLARSLLNYQTARPFDCRFVSFFSLPNHTSMRN